MGSVMTTGVSRQEQWTVAAAMVFLISVSVVSILPPSGSLPMLLLALSAILFVYVYVNR